MLVETQLLVFCLFVCFFLFFFVFCFFTSYEENKKCNMKIMHTFIVHSNNVGIVVKLSLNLFYNRQLGLKFKARGYKIQSSPNKQGVLMSFTGAVCILEI